MKKLTICLCFLAVMGFLCGNAMAADDITIPDLAGDGSDSGWYRSGPSDGSEDNEVEPGCATGQVWDLEAFLYDKGTNTLTAVGGFDFMNGYGGYYAGDIFIDTQPITASYGTDVYYESGNGIKIDNTDYGYNYVLDMDYDPTDPQASPSYTIYKLSGTKIFETVYFRENDESNPYRYVDGGVFIGTGDIETTFDFSGLGFVGDTHYAISVDLSKIWEDYWTDQGYSSSIAPDFLVHLTIGCGNDNMMGRWEGGSNPPVPEPATMLLVGTGLVGLASLRKKFKKS
ncbi:MAG: PEP-CTERM sorting domain-containing protein [Deltaproteobacteria bacterium]|nr:PEP-CTERM sorting domain-containing protein [Deltaproteobacteria bacterium]